VALFSTFLFYFVGKCPRPAFDMNQGKYATTETRGK